MCTPVPHFDRDRDLAGEIVSEYFTPHTLNLQTIVASTEDTEKEKNEWVLGILGLTSGCVWCGK